jgi:hypothetical protein
MANIKQEALVKQRRRAGETFWFAPGKAAQSTIFTLYTTTPHPHPKPVVSFASRAPVANFNVREYKWW